MRQVWCFVLRGLTHGAESFAAEELRRAGRGKRGAGQQVMLKGGGMNILLYLLRLTIGIRLALEMVTREHLQVGPAHAVAEF